MYAVLVLDETVVAFEAFRAMPTQKWQRIMDFPTMLDNLLGTDTFGTTVRTVIDAILWVALE